MTRLDLAAIGLLLALVCVAAALIQYGVLPVLMEVLK